MSSPRVIIRKNVHASPSGSPRKPFMTGNSFATSPRAGGFIPQSIAGQVKLYEEITSPQHKHLNSQFSSANLSNSIADPKFFATSSKGFEKEVTTPQKGRHTRVKTMANPETLQQFISPPTSPKHQPTKSQVNLQIDTAAEVLENHNKVTPKVGRSPLSVDTLAFRDELKKDYEHSPLIRVDEEAMYYDTIKHLDECGKCWADNKKNHSSPFKLNCKMPKNSSYQKDYPQHKPVEQPVVIKNEAYETIRPSGQVSLASTMKTSFQPWKSNYVRQEGVKPTLGPENATFFGRTSYNTDFYNLGSPKAFIERYPQAKSAVEGVDFKGESNYKQNFGNFFESKGYVTRWPKQQQRSPFPGGIPFLGQTTSTDFFKPFKTGYASNNDSKSEDYQSIDSFPNQFQSTYTKDFDGKPEWKCPAKIFIENNLPPRMNHLKAEGEF